MELNIHFVLFFCILVAMVRRPRYCTMCRECIRPEKFQDKIKLSRVRDHFLCKKRTEEWKEKKETRTKFPTKLLTQNKFTFLVSIESTGIVPPKKLFKQSIQILHDKCINLEKELKKLSEQHE